MQTTRRLVRAAQGGDRQALDLLFERHAPRVRRIAALRFGLTMDAFEDYEDIAQQALLRALQGLHGFDASLHGSSIGAFRHWLASCVESSIQEHFRKKGAQKRGRGKVRRFSDLGTERLSDSVFAGREPSPSKIAMGLELESRLETALHRLKKRYRDAIIYRQLCGMSYAEVARTMGFESEGNARLVVHRALQKLEAELRQEN